MLDGLKTYISGALIVLFAILFAFKIIDLDTFLKLLGIFAGLGLVSLRSAVAKMEKGLGHR